MLTIRHIRHWYEPRLPHAVFLDGLFAGMVGGAAKVERSACPLAFPRCSGVDGVKDDKLLLNAPRGNYDLKVQFGGRVPIGKSGKSIDISVSSTKQIEVPSVGDVEYVFHDRERLWNILFDIDLIAWVVSWFVTMPPIYKIISDAFFAVWLVRLVLIRKKYYKIEVINN